jgi:hypothetical protein
VVGSLRHSQIKQNHLHSKLRKVPANISSEEWVVRTLIPTAQAVLNCHNAWEGLADNERGILLLVAVRGELCVVQDDWAVVSPREGYAAIGTGSAIALGALHATKDLADGKKRCYKAIKAAAHHVPSVAEPVQYLFLRNDEGTHD